MAHMQTSLLPFFPILTQTTQYIYGSAFLQSSYWKCHHLKHIEEKTNPCEACYSSLSMNSCMKIEEELWDMLLLFIERKTIIIV